MTSPPLTAADLVRELRRKGASVMYPDDPAAMAGYITHHGLATAIAGKHLGKVVNFEQAYAHVFGRDLEGKLVKQKRPRKQGVSA